METTIASFALILMAALFTAGARARRARAVQLAAFSSGWLVLAGALISPLAQFAEKSLTAHMLQHEIFIVVAAPLLALGRPHHALIALLPHRRGGGAYWIRNFRVSAPIACILHAIALWAWHLPVLYQAATNQPLLHFAQHASFFGTALLFWCAVLDQRREYGAAALYTFVTSVHTGILGALMFLTPQPWYPIYGTGRAALEDQQLAGLIMWIPGGVLLAFTALCLVWCWLKDIERRALMRERLTLIANRTERALVISLILLGVGSIFAACNDARATAIALTGGNPEKGRVAIQKYGCWTCHNIPGIAGANGVVGPPLDKIASRAYVAGRPNSPEHLINWIRHPQQVRSPTPMPDMGVTEADARDIAAYLYTLL